MQTLWGSTRKVTETSAVARINRESDSLCIMDIPGMTSQWSSLFKLFKVRTVGYDSETILWPTAEEGLNLENWPVRLKRKKTEAESLVNTEYWNLVFQYFDMVLKRLNLDESNWWCDQSEQDLEVECEGLCSMIRAEMSIETDKLGFASYKEKIKGMNERLVEWLWVLREVLVLKKSEITESYFEEIFRLFFQIVGFTCLRGDVTKLTLQYKEGIVEPEIAASKEAGLPDLLVEREPDTPDKEELLFSVTSKPDLVIYNRRIPKRNAPIAVVQVKKSGGGIETEQLTAVELGGGASSSSTTSGKGAEAKHYFNGRPRMLTEEELKNCSFFLPQLFSEVLAALNYRKKPLLSVPLGKVPFDFDAVVPVKSVIGLGVVAFKVHVVNFLFVRREEIRRLPLNMHEIPCIKGMGTDILVSEPLSLLQRNDRNKLFRLLAAMKTMEFEEHSISDIITTAAK